MDKYNQMMAELKELIETSGLCSSENTALLETIIKDMLDSFKTEVTNENFKENKERLRLFNKTIEDMFYNFSLKKEEYLYLKEKVLAKVSYNRENIFIGMSVKDILFSSDEPAVNKTVFDFEPEKVFVLNINDVLRVSHMTSLWEEKGITSKSTMLHDITLKIGDITKIHTHYRSVAQMLSEQNGNWVSGISGEEDLDTEMIKS